MPKTFITATFIRLKKEAEKGGYIEQYQDKVSRILMRLSGELAKQSGKLTQSMVIVLLDELTDLVARVRVEMAIHRRIMDILMKWLPESGQRLAYRELRSVRIKDILGT